MLQTAKFNKSIVLLFGVILVVCGCTNSFGGENADSPSAPGAAILTPGDSQLTVTWDAVDNADSYEVWYHTEHDSDAATQFGGDITGTSTVITSLENGTTYFVWLKAKNSEGQYSFANPGVMGFRLPDFDEWDCAARYLDGSIWTLGTYASGANVPENATDDVVWLFASSSNPYTPEVGEKLANAIGGYDMSGNVAEPCFDELSSSGTLYDRLGRGECYGDGLALTCYLFPYSGYSRLGLRVYQNGS